MKSKKPKLVNGAELENLRHAWNAAKQAEAMARATWGYWQTLGAQVAKRHRIPRDKFHIDLKTGEVTRRG